MSVSVSIILPVYNQAPSIESTLESINSQSYEEYELIVINDGSDDNSEEILNKAARKDSRIKILNKAHSGIVDSINHGINYSSGELICRIDGDDIMLENKLKKQVEAFSSDSSLGLVSHKVKLLSSELPSDGLKRYISWQNNLTSNEVIHNNIFMESPFVHSSVIFKRSLLEQTGPYLKGDFPEDYELWLRMAEHRVKFLKLNEVLLEWRQSSNSLSKRDQRYSEEAFENIRIEYLAKEIKRRKPKRLLYWGAGKKARRKIRILGANGILAEKIFEVSPKQIGNLYKGMKIKNFKELENEKNFLLIVLVTGWAAQDGTKEYLLELGLREGSDFLMAGI